MIKLTTHKAHYTVHEDSISAHVCEVVRTDLGYDQQAHNEQSQHEVEGTQPAEEGEEGSHTCAKVSCVG